MIVCLCRAKSDRDVSRAIDAGATCLRDLNAAGIGGCCGGCHETLIDMLRAQVPATGRAVCAECCAEEVAEAASA